MLFKLKGFPLLRTARELGFKKRKKKEEKKKKKKKEIEVKKLLRC